METFLTALLALLVILLVVAQVSARAADRLGVIAFNLLLVLCTLPPYIVATLCMLSGKIKPMTKRSWRRWAVFTVTCLCWRLLFTLSSPWVRMDIEGLREFRKGWGASGRPVVLVSNHVSFMDTLVGMAMMSAVRVWKVRMIISSHLAKIPAVGTIVRAMDHKTINFSAVRDVNSLEVDKDSVADAQKQFAEHVLDGGIGAWFPEGKMNPGPDFSQIGQFRAGGFALCANEDVEIWAMAHLGYSTCWSRFETVGGHPCRIGLKFWKICDHSKSWAAQETGGGDPASRARWLANKTHAEVQAAVSEMDSKGCYTCPGRASSSTGAREPLVGNACAS